MQGKKSEPEASETEQVRFDNFYDQAFCDQDLKLWQRVNLKTKPGSLSLVHDGDVELDNSKAIDVMKVKVNKSYGLCSTLPKMQAVPATAHFFDLAGGNLTYGDAEVEAKRFEVQGVFSALKGFFGGK